MSDINCWMGRKKMRLNRAQTAHTTTTYPPLKTTYPPLERGSCE